MKSLFLTILAFVLCSVSHAAEKPNILFIAVDDLNDYISPLDNHPGVKTPNFERLAKMSVNFTNAHCASPACHPSRVAVMTGVHPSKSGIYKNLFGAHGPRWRDESPVLKDAIVLSQQFRDNGYRAVGGGKIFHTLQWTAGDSQNDPNAWDAYRGDPLDPISKDWPRPKLIPDAKAGLTPGRPLGPKQVFGAQALQVPDEETGDHMVIDWAIEQLNAKQDKPLFLAAGLFRPHIPFEVPQKYFDMYPLDKIQLPEILENDLEDARSHGRENWHEWILKNDQWKKFMQGYLASITYTDHQLGRLLDGLEASPLAENTIVVLWSDHGFHIGEKQNWEKFALWDQTTHVPLFIHAPGVSKNGARSKEAVALTDIYPTLCELAGIPTPEQCTGASLVPVLKDPEKETDRLALSSFHFANREGVSHAVADSRYRFIRYDDGFEELYDLEKDRNEFNNIVKNPEMAAIREKLIGGLPKDPAPSRGVPKDSKFNSKNKRSPPHSNPSMIPTCCESTTSRPSPECVTVWASLISSTRASHATPILTWAPSSPAWSATPFQAVARSTNCGKPRSLAGKALPEDDPQPIQLKDCIHITSKRNQP